MDSFNALSHGLIDAWLLPEEVQTPEQLIEPVLGKLSIKMAMGLLRTTEPDPYAWSFTRIKDFGFKSRILESMRKEWRDSTLRELDRSFIDDAVIPAFSRAIETRRPILDMVKTRLMGVRIGYERLILPQKHDGSPEWCLSLIEGRFFIPSHTETRTDITDDSIVQLLIEGHTAREIAEMIHLSPRTIEHRIDKMKERLEAKNLVHLVAKLVASQLDRREMA